MAVKRWLGSCWRGKLKNKWYGIIRRCDSSLAIGNYDSTLHLQITWLNATILHASWCLSSWNPLKVFHMRSATFSLNNTSQDKSEFPFFHTIFKHQTNTIYNMCTCQHDDDLQFHITLPDHSTLLAFFQMWLHPRQHWQLWSNSFHGCRQERTHFCSQVASREAPGKDWHLFSHVQAYVEIGICDLSQHEFCAL